MKKENTINNTDENILKLKTLHDGIVENIKILENTLLKKKSIHLGQYINYLIQLALCIEIGLKYKMLYRRNSEKIHSLKALFNMIDSKTDNFQNRFLLIKGYDKKQLTDYLNIIDVLFVELRYLELENNEKYNSIFINTLFNRDGNINVENMKKNEIYKFMKLLVEYINNYSG